MCGSVNSSESYMKADVASEQLLQPILIIRQGSRVFNWWIQCSSFFRFKPLFR